jgi:hypothetical protein
MDEQHPTRITLTKIYNLLLSADQSSCDDRAGQLRNEALGAAIDAVSDSCSCSFWVRNMASACRRLLIPVC